MTPARRSILAAALLVCASVTPVLALEPPPLFWFSRPAGRTGGMAQMPDSRILGPNLDGGAVDVYNSVGALIGHFGNFNKPSGVAVDGSGNIYVCDQFNHRVQKLSSSFVPLLNIGTPGTAPGQLQYPTNCALSLDGQKVFVTELLSGRVSVFSDNGVFLYTFGTQGAGPGQLDHPFGIVLEPLTGDLFVANQFNQRIDRWRQDGTYLGSFGQAGSGPDDFNLPVGLGIDADGNLWVTDQLNNRVKKVSQSGTTLAVFGSFGSSAGQFYNPWSVLPARDGTIWIGDTTNFRICFYRYEPVPTVARTWGALKGEYH